MGSDSTRRHDHEPAGSDRPQDAAPPGLPGKRTLTEQLAPADAWQIVQDRPAAVVGESARFTVPGADRYTRPGARYMCTWYIHFDAEAARAAGAEPVFQALPRQTSQSSFTHVFEFPGAHTVVCEADWQGPAKPPGATRYRLETAVTTRRLEDISRDALRDYDGSRRETQVRRTIVDHLDPRAAAQGREHDQQSAELQRKLTGQVAIRAVISDRSTGESVPLSLVIGRGDHLQPNPRGPGIHREVVKLLDLTRGVKRAEYMGASAQAAIDDLRDGNSYPRGLLELEIPPNELGIPPLRAQFPTTGASSLEEWAHALGLVSLGLSALATVVTGGLAAPLFVLAVGSAAASGALTTIDDLRATKVDGARIAVDVVQLTASILPFVSGFAKLARGASGAQAIAGMNGRWVQLAQLALDGGTTVWIEADAFAGLMRELESPQLAGPEHKAERDKRIILFIAGLVRDTAIIGTSAAGARRGKLHDPALSPEAQRVRAAMLEDQGPALRARLERQQHEARDRLASGRDWLGELEHGGGELVVRRGEVTVQLVQDLTLVTKQEIGLFRMMDGKEIGDRVLTIGWPKETRIPRGEVRRCILHSHPSGGLVFSEQDVQTLIRYGKDGNGQWSSIIVTPHIEGLDGRAKRFDVDAERARWEAAGRDWATHKNPDRE